MGAAEEAVVQGAATLGWVAAAGDHTFAGDQVVGVKSHDACPARSFFVPEGATRLVVEVGAGTGVGAYTLAVASPAEVAYERRPLPEVFLGEYEAPVPGVWRVEAIPSGVVASQAWELTVEMKVKENGWGGGELALVPDPDCLL